MIGAFLIKLLIFEACIILGVYGAITQYEERQRERDDEKRRRRRRAQRKDAA